jgi:flagellar basal-body rod modification protein FlgD
MSDTSISSTVPTTTGTMTTSSASSGGLKGTTDEFLKLFMAQLQQQDPFNPTSGADMVSQLAQLSAVEQQKQTNTALGDLTAAQSSEASAGLSSLIGRDCTASAGSFAIGTDAGTPPPMTITATAATKGASISVTDANGKEIRKIAIPDGTTSTTLQWDGKDASGNPVPAGNYKMTVDSGTGGSPSATWHGRVDSVVLTADGPRLRMGDVLIAPSDISTIGSNTTTAAASATALASKITSIINGSGVKS